MTRFLLLGVLLLASALATACMEVGYGYEFEEDTSGRFSIVFSMDQRVLGMLALSGEADPLQELEASAPPGFTAERFAEGNRVGIRLVGEFRDLEELRRQQGLLMGDLPAARITGEWTFLTGSFTFRQEFASQDLFGGEIPQPEDLSGLGGMGNLEQFGLGPDASLKDILSFFVTVTLPGAITSHNADEVSDHTLKWKPNVYEPRQVVVEASWEASLPVDSLLVETTIRPDGSAERQVSLGVPQNTQQTVERTQGSTTIEDYLLARIPQAEYSREDAGESVTHVLTFQAASLDELGRLSTALFGDDQISKAKSSGGILRERQRYREQVNLTQWLGQPPASGDVVVRYNLPHKVTSVGLEGATHEGRTVEVRVPQGGVIDIPMETQPFATSSARGGLLSALVGIAVGIALLVMALAIYQRRRHPAAPSPAP